MVAVSQTGSPRNGLALDLLLPTLLFAALGAMVWAVRGSAGASAMNAHIAPGLTWGAAWWFLARDPDGRQSRRYSSGWILFALTVGFAFAGNRGWVQWANFFEGHLLTTARRDWVPIPRSFGFLWTFLAGAGWAALPACFIAWSGHGRSAKAWEWMLRIAAGFVGGYVAWQLYVRNPQVFLPLYNSIGDKYGDLRANFNLGRLYRDNGSTVRHLGYCSGFLMFEVARRDWKNVTLISTVGIINGVGWAVWQNWRWAPHVWPGANFNFWRYWECCAGISIGVAFGVAYYLVNRRQTGDERGDAGRRFAISIARREWLFASGLLLVLGGMAFLPATRDLRRLSVETLAPNPAWGGICLAAAALLAAGAFLQLRTDGESLAGRSFLPSRDGGTTRMGAVGHAAPSARTADMGEAAFDSPIAYWGGIGIVLVFGWFIRNEINAGFGDGIRNASRPGLFGFGNIYFGILLIFCIASGVSRAIRSWSSRKIDQLVETTAAGDRLNLDWLVTYCSLGVIVIAGIGVNMATGWNAPMWFGILGVAFGVVYFLLNARPASGERIGEIAKSRSLPSRKGFTEDPNLERWGAFLGLLYGLGLSLRKAFNGGARLYLGDENYWDRVCWNWVAIAMLVWMLVGIVWLLYSRLHRNLEVNAFPHATAIIWLVLIAENVLAQIVTGPAFGPQGSWFEFTFNVLYLILFALTAVIVYHFQVLKEGRARLEAA